MADENEQLRVKLGVAPDAELDLGEFRRVKAIQREEDRALIVVLQQEVRVCLTSAPPSVEHRRSFYSHCTNTNTLILGTLVALDVQVEKLEEERRELKRKLRALARQTGQRAANLGLTADDLMVLDEPDIPGDDLRFATALATAAIETYAIRVIFIGYEMIYI